MQRDRQREGRVEMNEWTKGETLLCPVRLLPGEVIFLLVPVTTQRSRCYLDFIHEEIGIPLLRFHVTCYLWVVVGRFERNCLTPRIVDFFHSLKC